MVNADGIYSNGREATRPLTPRQQEIAAFIIGEVASSGRCPTYREIGKRFNITSTNAVSDHIRAIRAKGFELANPVKPQREKVVDTTATRAAPVMEIQTPRVVIKRVVERVVKVVEAPMPAAMRRQIRSARRVEEWRKKRTSMKTYAIEALDIGFIKIGKSTDVAKRLTALQTGMPCELRLLFVYDCDIEKDLHAELWAYRARGEWFTKNDVVMATLEARHK